MLTWFVQLYRRFRLARLEMQSVYVSQSTLTNINRERNLRQGGNR
jgi:hypothetical protein